MDLSLSDRLESLLDAFQYDFFAYLGVNFNVSCNMIFKRYIVVKQNKVCKPNTEDYIFKATNIAEYIVKILNLPLMIVKTVGEHNPSLI